MADLLYRRLRLAEVIQFDMWTYFCIRTAKLAGGTPRGGVVTTCACWVIWPPMVGTGLGKKATGISSLTAGSRHVCCGAHHTSERLDSRGPSMQNFADVS
jgi:hypothetical protein